MKIAINHHWQNKQPVLPEDVATVEPATGPILAWLHDTFGAVPWVEATTAPILQRYLDRGQPSEVAIMNAFFRWYNGGFANVDIPAGDVAAAVKNGWGYSAQHKGYRHQKNFVSAQHIDLDFDTCDFRSTIDYLLDEFVRQPGGAAFIYTTASHTEENPKARIFFELSEPITDPAYYRELRAALLHGYQWADQVNKDPARISYGAAGCTVYWLGHVLDIETAHNRFVLPYRAHLANEAAKRQPVTLGQPGLPANQPSDKLLAAFLRGKLDYLLGLVSSAADGTKYHTLQRVAFTLGGYVASGYYDHFQTAHDLYNAIRRNPNNVKSLAAAEDCINSALQAGMSQPLYIDLAELKSDKETAPRGNSREMDSSWQTAAATGSYEAWLKTKQAGLGWLE